MTDTRLLKVEPIKSKHTIKSNCSPKKEGKTYYKAYYEMNHPEMEAVFKVQFDKAYSQKE